MGSHYGLHRPHHLLLKRTTRQKLLRIQIVDGSEGAGEKCVSKLAAALSREIQLAAGNNGGLETAQRVLPIAIPALFASEIIDPHTPYDLVILVNRLALNLPPNLDGNAGGQEIGHVVQAAAHTADLPINHGEIVTSFGAEEHIVQPEIAVAEGQRARSDSGNVLDDAMPVRLG